LNLFLRKIRYFSLIFHLLLLALILLRVISNLLTNLQIYTLSTLFLTFLISVLFTIICLGQLYENTYILLLSSQISIIGIVGLGIDMVLSIINHQHNILIYSINLPLNSINLFLLFLLFLCITKVKNGRKLRILSFIVIIFGVISLFIALSFFFVEDFKSFLSFFFGFQMIIYSYLSIRIESYSHRVPISKYRFAIKENQFQVAMIIPAHNEERLILNTLSGIPQYIKRVYVVNDGSTDRTADIVREFSKNNDPRIELIDHTVNKGVGAAIITGYFEAYKNNYDCFVVVGADAQMEMNDLSTILKPIIEGEAEYVKGNRFIYRTKFAEGNAWREMPKLRILGNILLSIITIIGSGYVKIFDSQMGYTAIHKDVIPLINWNKARQGYGYPGDWLCRFHTVGIRVKDAPTRTIYLKNERQTQIKVKKFLFYTSWVMLKAYIFRLKKEYFFSRKFMVSKVIVLSQFFFAFIYLLGAIIFLTSNIIPLYCLVYSFQSGILFIISDIIRVNLG